MGRLRSINVYPDCQPEVNIGLKVGGKFLYPPLTSMKVCKLQRDKTLIKAWFAVIGYIEALFWSISFTLFICFFVGKTDEESYGSVLNFVVINVSSVLF